MTTPPFPHNTDNMSAEPSVETCPATELAALTASLRTDFTNACYRTLRAAARERIPCHLHTFDDGEDAHPNVLVTYSPADDDFMIETPVGGYQFPACSVTDIEYSPVTNTIHISI